MHYDIRKYFHNQKSEGISYLRDVRSPDVFCNVEIFLEKREASLHEKMQRLPEEAGDPGDSLQC